MPEMIGLTAIEDAIVRWISAASGRPLNCVSWSELGGPPPSMPYFDLKWTSGPTEIGDDWSQYQKTDDDVILQHLRGHRVMTLQVQCFVTDDTTESAARGMLAQLMTSRRLDAHRISLRAAKVAIAEVGEVRSLPGSETFDPRAICELTVHTAVELTGPGHAIERVQVVVSNAETDDVIVDVEVDRNEPAP